MKLRLEAQKNLYRFFARKNYTDDEKAGTKNPLFLLDEIDSRK